MRMTGVSSTATIVYLLGLGFGSSSCAHHPPSVPEPLEQAIDENSTPAWRWSGEVPAGESIEIKNVRGLIRAVGTTAGQITVRAIAQGGDGLGGVTFEVLEHERGVTVCAVYPTPRGAPANECRPGAAGQMNPRASDVQIAMVVGVPADVLLVARSVSGDVVVRNVVAGVGVHTVSGMVDVVSAAPNLRVETVNGGVRLEVPAPTWAGRIHVTTVNGPISVSLADVLTPRFHVSTVNGHVTSDFPLAGSRNAAGERSDSRRPDVILSNVNGPIEIHKRVGGRP